MRHITMVSRFSRFAAFLLLLISLTLTAAEVQAFGKLGHQLVCHIASWEFKPETKKEIQTLLSHTRYRHFSAACNWPDHVKSQRAYQWARHLHYMNVPRSKSRVDIARDCPKGCVLTAITRFSDEFVQGQNSDERARALMFLGHFVGDIHQALHVSYADDLGGNKVKAVFKGARTNLHKIWDSELISETDTSESILGERLLKGISEIQRRAWASNAKHVTAWANESLAMTRRIYAELPFDGHLSDGYFRRYNPLVLEQIQKGGIRLGSLLNQLVAERGQRQ